MCLRIGHDTCVYIQCAVNWTRGSKFQLSSLLPLLDINILFTVFASNKCTAPLCIKWLLYNKGWLFPTGAGIRVVVHAFGV